MEDERLRVLIVDDEPDHREILADAILTAFPDVETGQAETAAEALAAAREGHWQAVILDYLLPDQTAIEVLPRLLEIAPDLVIIVTTARGDEEVAAAVLKAGAADYVVKSPRLLTRLPQSLEAALQASRLRRQARQAEHRVLHLNSVLRAIRNISQAINQIRDRDDLLQRVCDTLLEARGYNSAWVLLLDQQGNLEQGFEAGLGDAFTGLLDQIRTGGFPPCLAAVTNSPDQVVVAGPDTHPNWCPGAVLHDGLAVMAASLQSRGSAYGSLFVAVPREVLDDEEEHLLFTELANDVSRALYSLGMENERLRAEEDLRELNRLYTVLTHINETVVRVRDRDDLFRETCRIAVEEGGFVLAWVGLLDEATHWVKPAAHFGREDDYLVNIRISADDIPEGRGPVGTAIRENHFSVIHDIQHDATMLPWVKPSTERGYRSAAAFPLVVRQHPIGGVAFYSDRTGFFTPQRVELLEALAADLSFALELIEQEELRRQALDALRTSEQTFRTTVENAPIGLVMRRGLKLLYVNPTLLDMLGYGSTEEVPGESVLELYAPEERESIGARIEARDRGEDVATRFDVQVLTHAGERRTHVLNVTKVMLPDGPAAMGFHTDISDRIRIEEELRHEIAEREQVQQQLLVQQSELRSLAAEIALAEERERRRVATQLHDTVVQFLAFAKIKLGLLQQRTMQPEVQETLQEVEDLLQDALSRSRSVMYELSASSLYEIGFEVALSHLTDQFGKQHNLDVSFSQDAQPKPLAMDLQITLFQALRELLMNITQHAQSRLARVSLVRREDLIELSVSDNGVGFDPEELAERSARQGGFGLFSIRERLRHFGGTMELESAPNQGTKVTLTVPVSEP